MELSKYDFLSTILFSKECQVRYFGMDFQEYSWMSQKNSSGSPDHLWSVRHNRSEKDMNNYGGNSYSELHGKSKDC